MIADNIDSLETTLSASGTSHQVNSTLIIKGKSTETDDVANEVQERPSKRKCRLSLPTDLVAREILDYYGGKRMGPGELAYVKDLTIASSYKDKAFTQRELYLIWIEIRKLKTHPVLLIPGWTGLTLLFTRNWW